MTSIPELCHGADGHNTTMVVRSKRQSSLPAYDLTPVRRADSTRTQLRKRESIDSLQMDKEEKPSYRGANRRSSFGPTKRTIKTNGTDKTSAGRASDSRASSPKYDIETVDELLGVLAAANKRLLEQREKLSNRSAVNARSLSRRTDRDQIHASSELEEVKALNGSAVSSPGVKNSTSHLSRTNLSGEIPEDKIKRKKKLKFKTRKREGEAIEEENSRQKTHRSPGRALHEALTDVDFVRPGLAQDTAAQEDKLSSSVTYAHPSPVSPTKPPPTSAPPTPPSLAPLFGSQQQHQAQIGQQQLLDNHRPLVAKDLLNVKKQTSSEISSGPMLYPGKGDELLRGPVENMFVPVSVRDESHQDDSTRTGPPAPLIIGHHLNNPLGPIYNSPRGLNLPNATPPSADRGGIGSNSFEWPPNSRAGHHAGQLTPLHPIVHTYLGPYGPHYPLANTAAGGPMNSLPALNSRFGESAADVPHSQVGFEHPLQRLMNAARNQEEAALAYERRRLAYEMDLRRRQDEARRQHEALIEQQRQEQQRQQQQPSQQAPAANQANGEEKGQANDEGSGQRQQESEPQENNNASDSQNSGPDSQNSQPEEGGEQNTQQEQQQQANPSDDQDMKNFQNFVGGDDSDFTDLFPPGIFSPAEIREMKRDQEEQRRRQEQEEQEERDKQANEAQEDGQNHEGEQANNTEHQGEPSHNQTAYENSSNISDDKNHQQATSSSNEVQLQPDNGASRNDQSKAKNLFIEKPTKLPSYMFANVNKTVASGQSNTTGNGHMETSRTRRSDSIPHLDPRPMLVLNSVFHDHYVQPYLAAMERKNQSRHNKVTATSNATIPIEAMLTRENSVPIVEFDDVDEEEEMDVA